ncbi:MAG: hypothetical protein HY912_24735 [Desulfomonile tiedjei]|uniref:Uncharacterized protein n=1 Tax=Desulfomonile tiedjei TaxID=2358 RepID=A0A9D6V8U8_9BACT|nr:hypothetical protein [Desulfomonile tiedjei]
MAIQIEDFLGTALSIPEDRFYEPEEGLWLKRQPDGTFAVGFTEPALLMTGAMRDIEMLVDSGAKVNSGETVLLGLTAKLKYIACPLPGIVTFPEQRDGLGSSIMADPYNTPLFFVDPSDFNERNLSNAAVYCDFLKNSEGARNPKGLKGGVSPTCKAVYMGLGQQKFD